MQSAVWIAKQQKNIKGEMVWCAFPYQNILLLAKG